MSIQEKIQVSVIIPYYNSEHHIRRCITSVIQQKNVIYEVLCVNDGSSDNSATVVNQYCKQFPYITNYNTNHRGVSHARNIGLKNAKGEYIYFIDSDDELIPNSLHKMYNIANKHKLDSLIFGAKVKGDSIDYWIKDSIKVKKYYTDKFEINNIFHLKGIKPFIWQHFIKKEILVKNKIEFNETLYLGEDQNFILHYMSKITNLKIIKKRYYKHWIHYESVCGNKKHFTKEDFKQHQILAQDVLNYYLPIIDTTPQIYDWIFDTIYYAYLKTDQDIQTTQTTKTYLKTLPLCNLSSERAILLYKLLNQEDL